MICMSLGRELKDLDVMKSLGLWMIWTIMGCE